MLSPQTVVCSDHYLDALRRLPPPERGQVDETVRKLQIDPRYPGLQTHRIHHPKADAWECYVSYQVRLVFEPARGREPLKLWYVGQHALVDNIRQRSFAETTQFRALHPEAEAAPDSTHQAALFVTPEAWLTPTADVAAPAAPFNPLALHPAANLRLLGVPSALVAAVRAAPSLADLEHIAGLPERALLNLLDLATNADLQPALFDPSLLARRDTLDRLEDYCAGKIRKLMIHLSPEQEACMGRIRAGIVLLRGTAGSGKTSIGLAHALLRARQGRRVLLLTFNNSLVEGLRSLILDLEGAMPPTLSLLTVDSLLNAIAREQTLLQPTYRDDVLKSLLNDAIQMVDGADVLQRREGGEFFPQEIDALLKARGVASLEAYQGLERRGRGQALGAQQRQTVWETYQQYQAELGRQRLRDGNDTAQLVRTLPAAALARWQFDDIVVDETQDFALVKLLAAMRCLRAPRPDEPEDRQPTLLLLADAAQTIYTRGVFWTESDLPPVTKLFLRRNFRNSRQIADAAASLLAANKLRAQDVAPLDVERAQRAGLPPVIVTCRDFAAQTQWVGECILELCDGQELRYADCAILCRTNKHLKLAAAALAERSLPHVEDPRQLDLLANTVKILTFQSAKGLEFPVVFVVGVDFGTVPNYAVLKDLAGDDLRRATECERALLYVAMTRAADQLTLLTSLGHASPFLAELGPTVRRENG